MNGLKRWLIFFFFFFFFFFNSYSIQHPLQAYARLYILSQDSRIRDACSLRSGSMLRTAYCNYHNNISPSLLCLLVLLRLAELSTVRPLRIQYPNIPQSLPAYTHKSRLAHPGHRVCTLPKQQDSSLLCYPYEPVYDLHTLGASRLLTAHTAALFTPELPMQQIVMAYRTLGASRLHTAHAFELSIRGIEET